MDEKKAAARRPLNGLFGGLSMSWPIVIAFAVAAALVTALVLILPVFEHTSFERIGVHLEAWILFAVVIMANCKKPLESALKVFVFFLVSQPLIYLFQVPFSYQGWGLFRYYTYWFVATLLTFPMAYIGWYINKRNWLSVLIFAPVLAFLGMVAYQCLLGGLPLASLFCLAQIVLYILGFCSDVRQMLAAAAVAAAAVALIALYSPRVALTVIQSLPDEPSFSQTATVTVDDESIAQVQLHSPESGSVYIYAHDLGTTAFTVTDGGRQTRYELEVFRQGSTTAVRLTPLD